MKAITLGIFSKMSMKYWKSDEICKYPFNNVIPRDMLAEYNSIMEIVSLGLSRCDKCYFHLDGILFPLSDNSFTCQELKFVLDHPYLLDKIQFMLNDKELTESEALTYIQRTDLITK